MLFNELVSRFLDVNDNHKGLKFADVLVMSQFCQGDGGETARESSVAVLDQMLHSPESPGKPQDPRARHTIELHAKRLSDEQFESSEEK